MIFKLSKKDFIDAKIMTRSGAAGHQVVRAMTLVLRHKGMTRAEVADVLDITPRTVTNTCSTYSEFGLHRSIEDDPRPGRPEVHSSTERAKIVAVVCSDPPVGFDRWTLELLQSEVVARDITPSISKEQIRLVLLEHDLKPWRQKMWCVPKLTDQYIERMEAILDLYDTPTNLNKPIVCIDEKPVVLHEDGRDGFAAIEGSIKKVDYEYKRRGTANVFMAVNPNEGTYVAKVTERRAGEDFAHFLKELSDQNSEVSEICLVMDNLSTHSITSLTKTFGDEEGERIWKRFKIFRTPTHASWLNQAEIAIGMYSRQCLGKTRIPDIEMLSKKTKAWSEYINEKSVKINWAFSKLDAREKMGYGGKD